MGRAVRGVVLLAVVVPLLAPAGSGSGFGALVLFPDSPGPQPTYNAGASGFQWTGPADQSGTLLLDCRPTAQKCPIGYLNAEIMTGGSTSVSIEGTERIPGGIPEETVLAPGAGAFVDPIAPDASTAPRMIYVAIFGKSHFENNAPSPYRTGSPPFLSLAADACQGRTKDGADADSTADCYLLTQLDIELYTRDLNAAHQTNSGHANHVPAVCAYIPGAQLLQPRQDGLCRDVELRFHSGDPQPATVPGWFAQLPYAAELHSASALHVVVAPSPTDARCIQPGFEVADVPAHDVDDLRGMAEVTGASDIETVGEAEGLGVTTIKLLDGQVEPPAGFQLAGGEPDQSGDNSGALVRASAGPGCGPDGVPTPDAVPWSNHIRAPVWQSAGIGWWEVHTPYSLLVEGNPVDPSLGAIHYVSNAYFDDLGITRDNDGDGAVSCTGEGFTDECVPLIWDLGNCAAMMTGFDQCANQLGTAYGFKAPTGLVLTMRTQGPIVFWDVPNTAPDRAPKAIIPDLGVVCMVGYSPGLAGWPGLSAIIADTCNGVAPDHQVVVPTAFRPQLELGEFQSQVRWSWLPNEQLDTFDPAQLTLRYVLTVNNCQAFPASQCGLDLPIGMAEGDPLDLGHQGAGAPTVKSWGSTITYEWVDATTIPR